MKKILSESFYDRLKEIYSKEELKIIDTWFATKKKPVYFRVNTLKSNCKKIENELKKNDLDFGKISFLEKSYKLNTWLEKDLWDLDIYKNWEIYLQSLTSQIPVLLFSKDIFKEKRNNIKILDLAAAPWWKTSQLSELSENKWEIIACEKSKIRSEKMKYNLGKLWCKNIKIIFWDSRYSLEDYSDNYFDLILFDAPCSWEWIINYNKEKSYNWWNIKHIKTNYNLQKDIIKNNLRLLKKWWEFIYSTCTLAPEENEWIVHFLLCNFPEMEIQNILLKSKYVRKWIKKFSKYIYKNEVEKAIRIIPSEENDWFFVAKFKKV